MRQLEQTTADTWPGFAQWLFAVAPELAVAFVMCALAGLWLAWELRK